MNKKVLIIIPIVIIAVVIYKMFIANDIKTSVVTRVYNGSERDGCDGFKFKNGDKIYTYCGWSMDPPPSYDPEINEGDTVEYGTKDGKPFVRHKQN